MDKTLLIDGDIVAYKVAAACEEAVDWGNDFWTLHADAKEGKAQVDIYIEELKDILNVKHARVFLSSKTNFRHELYPDYKANRKNTRKPMILGTLKEHMAVKWDAETEDNLEADDLIGIAATDPDLGGYHNIAVSVDKDFKSIPCSHYNPDKPEDNVFTVTVDEADRYHLMQTLVGDSTDNYKGCPSVGPVKANKLLDESETTAEAWGNILKAFDKAGLSSQHALVQARLAKILRHENYDYQTKTIKHWEPPNAES